MNSIEIYKALLNRGILNRKDQINEEKIKPILEKIKKGLKQYISIQQSVYSTNVEKDLLFQESFSNFYGLRFCDQNWKKEFFSLFERSKNIHNDFGDILKILWSKKNSKKDVSFPSKLVATLDPTFPVIDSNVRRNLNCEKEYNKICNDLEKVIIFHKDLTTDFKNFLITRAGQNIIKRFKEEYPYARITEVKMLDFILWQL